MEDVSDEKHAAEDDINLFDEFRGLHKKLSGSQNQSMDQLHVVMLFVAKAIMKNHNISVAVRLIFYYFIIVISCH